MERLERLADRLATYVAVITIPRPGQVPYVVTGDREDLVADYVGEIIRRQYGDGLVDQAWLAAHPYPRSRTGSSIGWLDRLLEVSDCNPNVIRVGPVPLVEATTRRPDVAPPSEYRPYQGVIIRRSTFTDGELIEYTVWNRTAPVSHRFTTHAAFRCFMALLTAELGRPRPEEWGPHTSPGRRVPMTSPDGGRSTSGLFSSWSARLRGWSNPSPGRATATAGSATAFAGGYRMGFVAERKVGDGHALR
ncbi:hypothetical protein ACFY4C_37030 [Actinomadura viridis]|uniref:hypothetical protein n=1 Tax=Actinomadura viridis TaxID=58110 RepID=UPI003688B020